jgi:hypothetical protein
LVGCFFPFLFLFLFVLAEQDGASLLHCLVSAVAGQGVLVSLQVCALVTPHLQNLLMWPSVRMHGPTRRTHPLCHPFPAGCKGAKALLFVVGLTA